MCLYICFINTNVSPLSQKVNRVNKMKQKEENVSAMSNEMRSTWAKEHITNAAIELLKLKPIEKISISELSDHAGTGRATFYRNYKDITDIFRQYLTKLNKEWISTVSYDKGGLKELVYIIFSHFEKYHDFYALLNERGLIYILKDVIFTSLHYSTEGPAAVVYSQSFVFYMLYGWIETWFSRGMKETPEEMSAVFPEKI